MTEPLAEKADSGTPRPIQDVFRMIAEEDLDPALDRTTWRAAWLAAARIVEEAKPLVPPGPCWHNSGVTWPGQNFPVRCDLLAGHDGAHKAPGRMGGEVVWTNEESTHAHAE